MLMYNNPQCSDVMIRRRDGTQIHAHLAILMQFSKYFAPPLYGKAIEFSFPDYPDRAVNCIIQYIYGIKAAPTNCEDMCSAVRLAGFLKMSVAIDWLVDNFTGTIVPVALLETAYALDNQKLLD